MYMHGVKPNTFIIAGNSHIALKIFISNEHKHHVSLPNIQFTKPPKPLKIWRVLIAKIPNIHPKIENKSSSSMKNKNQFSLST